MAKKRLSKSTKRGVRRTIAALLMVSALIVAAIPGQGINAESEDDYYEDEDLTGAYGETPSAKNAGVYVVNKLAFEVNDQGVLVNVRAASESDYDWYWGEEDYDYSTTTYRNPSVSDDDLDNPDYFITETSSTKKYGGVAGTYAAVDKSTITSITVPEAGTVINLQGGGTITFPKVTVVGDSSNNVYDCSSGGFYNVTSFVCQSETTEIAKHAFDGNSKITSVTGLNKVTKIGDSAFANCTNLTNASDTSNVKEFGYHAFFNCTNLNSLKFKQVENISNAAFEKCGISSADMSGASSLVTIPEECFKDCPNLNSVSLPASTKYIKPNAFYVSYAEGETPISSSLRTISMPGVEQIGANAFKDCKNLYTINGLENLTVIDNNAFSNCSALTTFTFPESLYSLGMNAFEECSSLSKLNFKPADGNLETVESGETLLNSIPECAFLNCTSLTSLEIPNGVKQISGKAFSGCSGLKEISLPKSLSSFSGQTFDDTRNLTDIYIYNDSMEFPSMDAFVGLSNRNSLIIHGNLKTEDGKNNSKAYDYANTWSYKFVSVTGDVKEANYLINAQGIITHADIDNLTSKNQSIVVPSYVDSIEVKGIAADGVFRGVTSIVTIELPESCVNIADNAFADCTNLYRVTIPNPECEIGTNAFYNVASDFELAGEIDEDSKPFNYAMNNTPSPIPFVSADGYYRVENLDGVRTLTEYDSNLTDVTINTGIDAFGKKKDGSSTYSGIFEDNDNLESINIKGVTSLNTHEFYGCDNLKNVILPSTLTSMGLAPFYGCYNLADVNIDSKNPVFSCEKGIIYDNSKGEHEKIVEVLAGASSYELIIEEPVKELAEEACAGTKNLGEVYFLDGVTQIPSRCFANSRILNVDLTNSDVTTIRKNAFEHADSLRQMVIPSSVKEINSPVDEELGDGASVEIVGELNSPAYYHAEDNPVHLHFKKASEYSSSKSSSSYDPSGSSSSTSTSSSSSGGSSDTTSSSKKSSGSSSKKTSSKSSSSSKKSSSSTSSSSSSSSSSTSSSSVLQNVIVVNSDSNASNRDNTGNAKVDAGDSGLDDQDLISGSIEGDNAENYMIRITQTEEATAEFENALRGKYATLDAIEYFPMDISLYDSTGTRKIENPVGVEVTITIPIPDELSVYGGNNKMAAVSNSSLENLDTRFSNINDRNCVTFTARHFSPYGLYVDTDNLSADNMLDASPKTGDPISPKWFISLALVALSLLLFFKKEPEKKLINA